MRKFLPHPWGWASLAPLACALHCAVTPLLVVAAPALAPGPRLEWTLLAVTVVVALGALAIGLARHGNPLPTIPVGVGILLWTASLLHVFHPIPEDATTPIAALVVAIALVWNARLHCAGPVGRIEGCPRCDGSGAEAPAPVSAVDPARSIVPAGTGVRRAGSGAA